MQTSVEKKKMYRNLPPKLRDILIISDGWLVGSAIKKILANEKVRDFDIAVPEEKWAETICALRGYKFELNTFGGFKFTIPNGESEFELDIWPQNFDRFLKVASSYSYLFNLRHQKLLKLEE